MAINCSIDLPVMAAVTIGKKLIKTGSIFMGRGEGMDRGSAGARLRAWLWAVGRLLGGTDVSY